MNNEELERLLHKLVDLIEDSCIANDTRGRDGLSFCENIEHVRWLIGNTFVDYDEE